MSIQENQVELLLWEPSGVNRKSWPITFGVPFPQGKLKNKDQICLTHGENELPLCTSITSRWHDGSIRWLLLDFQTDLSGNEKKRLFLKFGDKTKYSKKPDSKISISESEDKITVHNGDIKVLFGQGIPFDKIFFKDKPVIINDGRICMVQENGRKFFCITDISRIKVETQNDLRAVIKIEGKFQAPDENDYSGTCLNLCTRLCFYAGKPFIRIYHTITNLEGRDVDIEELSFNITGIPGSTVSGYVTGQGLNDSIHPAEQGKVSIGIRTVPVPETRYSAVQLAPHVACKNRLPEIDGSMEYRAAMRCEIQTGDELPDNIEKLNTIQGDNLLYPITASGLICEKDVCIALTCSNFYSQAPKKLSVDNNHLDLQLYWNFNNKPLQFWRGTAKTHVIHLLIDNSEEPSDKKKTLDYKRMILALEENVFPTYGQSNWIQKTEVFGPIFKYEPEKYPWLEFMFREIMEKRFYNIQSVGYDHSDNPMIGKSILDFGDAWNPSRGGQWQNNEMDFGGAILLYMLRTGNPRPFPLAESIIHHMIDVDTHHEAEDESWTGAQRYHQVVHGAFSPPLLCHQWLEGPLFYYFLTGYKRAYEIAEMRAQAFCSAIEAGMHRIKQLERVQGWPLVALSTMNDYFPDKRYVKACNSVLDWLEQWIKEDGDMVYEVFGPVLQGKGNGILGRGVICQALTHYHRMTGDSRALDILIKSMEKAIKLVLTPEGFGVKTSFLRRNYYAPGESDFILEPFGYMYELTGEKRWMELGLLNFKLALVKRNPFGGRIGVAGNCTEAFRFWPSFLYYADKSGMLKDISIY